MKQVWVALCCLAGLAVAAEGQLPDNVADLYRAYQSAEQSGDVNAAFVAAEAVYEAAERADIDPASWAAIAENLGYFAAAIGDDETAWRAWREAARTTERSGGEMVMVGWRWHNAAKAAIELEDWDDARDASDRALQAFETLPDLIETHASLLGTAYYLNADIHFRLGRYRFLSEPALRAVAAFEVASREPDIVFGQSYYYAGLNAFMEKDYEDAAVYMHLAGDILRLAGAPEGSVTHANGLSAAATLLADNDRLGVYRPARHVQTHASASEILRERIWARIDANKFHNLSSELVDAENDGLPVGAEPARRLGEITLSYPPRAAQAGIEGVVIAGVDVDETGEVSNARIVFSLPGDLFDEMVMNEIEGIRFEPARLDGQPIAHPNFMMQFNFELLSSRRRQREE